MASTPRAAIVAARSSPSQAVASGRCRRVASRWGDGEATNEQVRRLATAELDDRPHPSLDLSDRTGRRQHPEVLVGLLDVVDEVEVVGALQDDHLRAAGRALVQLTDAGQRQEGVGGGDDGMSLAPARPARS